MTNHAKKQLDKKQTKHLMKIIEDSFSEVRKNLKSEPSKRNHSGKGRNMSSRYYI
jgi:hypothetical protein